MKNGKRILEVKIKYMDEEDPDISWLEGERFEAFKNEQFGFIGVRADANILLPANLSMTSVERASTCSYITQQITSGGLWGIESDSDKQYLKEIEQEQLDELKDQLISLGFSRRAIATAFKSV